MRVLLGPQGEPVFVFEERDRNPDSFVTPGTDREQAKKKFAGRILRGPQGEILLPPTEQGICPLCGAGFPETCSQRGEDPDGFDDPDGAPLDDRDDMLELPRNRK